MSLAAKLLSASGGADKLYVDDVFSAYTYTGNGSTQTINNGIDLAGEGGLVWIKRRNGSNGHYLFDTERPLFAWLNTASTNAAGGNNFFNISNQGFGLLTDWSGINSTGSDQASWTFRKAPKFFDVVTYTGNGASSRAIAHLLGQEVGMVMTKATSITGDWNTYHRSATGDLVLNTTATQTGSKALVNSATTSTFTVSGAANTNAVTYVAYLFAHDSSADGIVQCGVYVGNVSGNATVNLGWEPQFVIRKSSNTATNWFAQDSIRGMAADGSGSVLVPNTSSSEGAYGPDGGVKLTATGFDVTGIGQNTYIYLAIRRPNKPPTSGTQVLETVTRTGTGGFDSQVGSSIVADLAVIKSQGLGTQPFVWGSRLTSGYTLQSSDTTAEKTDRYITFGKQQIGVRVEAFGPVNAAITYVNWLFRRAPGFFDVVCDMSTGAAHTVAHELGVAPELWIRKVRNDVNEWTIGCSLLGAGKYLQFNTAAVVTDTAAWNNTLPTISVFTLGTLNQVNRATPKQYVTYLFASLPGISKVGSYTGNGTSQTIDCGFTTGARFVMIKRTDAAGDWYVWDTVRGLVAGNDPHLSLNSEATEITTDDSLDPASVGFIVNQLAATNINVTSASYIYLSFA